MTWEAGTRGWGGWFRKFLPLLSELLARSLENPGRFTERSGHDQSEQRRKGGFAISRYSNTGARPVLSEVYAEQLLIHFRCAQYLCKSTPARAS